MKSTLYVNNFSCLRAEVH